MHDSRVAARRARSTLRTFRKLFDTGSRTALDASLQGYAARLGQVRDLQVLESVLGEHATGDLSDWLTAHVQRDLAAAWQQLERELDATDHRQLSDQMAAVILSPVRPADLCAAVERSVRTAEKQFAGAGNDADRLHTARKAAKRARYAGEATGDTRLAHRFRALQDVLGSHRDLVVAADFVSAAPLPAEKRAEADVLVARLRADADRTRSRAVL